MSLGFSFDEVIEMALEMEREGVEFYRALAEREEERKSKELFLALAEMENEHLRTFQEMKEQLGSKTLEELVVDPQGEALLYLKAFVKGKVFKTSPASSPEQFDSLQDILKFAVSREKDSVVFYLGFMEAMRNDDERARLKKIIREELGHIAELNQLLEELSK